MEERAALDVVAVRALETADNARTLWTDADRAWATRAAAEVVGEHAAPATFLARRAALALERVGATARRLPGTFRAWRWRPWITLALVGAAFLIGIAVDRAQGGQQINVLAPPVLALLLWNLVVYAVLAVGFVVRYGEGGHSGALRRAVVWLAEARRGVSRLRRRAHEPGAMAVTAFATEWPLQVGPLYAARAARVLHLASAALAVGIIAGLYLRGIAFEYRATWESTFLDASAVHAILRAAYAPGAWLTGIPVPDVTEVAAIASPASENAARWLHLMVGTLALLVVVPRLLLAGGTWLIERYRATHLLGALDESYFQRLLREYAGGPTVARIVPYSFTLDAAQQAALGSIVVRAFGANARLQIEAPVAYGGAVVRADTERRSDTVIALFNVTATPERETHGAFLAALLTQGGTGQTVLAAIDESAFRARWPHDGARRDARHKLWRDFCAEYRLAPAFVDLSAPDLDAAAAAFDADPAAAAPRSA